VEAFAQATAQIHGTVQDMSGAAIPGANVKATQAETGLARNTTSDADGNYVLTNLPLGPCSSQPPRSHRRFRSVHRAYGDVPGVVLLFCDRARPPQDPALQRHTAPVGRLGGAAVTRSLSGSGPLSLCDPGPRFDLRRQRGHFPEGDRAEAETNGRAVALAKRNRGKMDRKLPPRDARSVIALNERHLRHLIGDYIHYHEQDRIHDSLDKDTPNRRSVERKPATWAGVISLPRLGGLHHRYVWCQAA